MAKGWWLGVWWWWVCLGFRIEAPLGARGWRGEASGRARRRQQHTRTSTLVPTHMHTRAHTLLLSHSRVQGQPLALDGAGGALKAYARAPLRRERFKPQAKLDVVRIPLRPASECVLPTCVFASACVWGGPGRMWCASPCAPRVSERDVCDLCWARHMRRARRASPHPPTHPPTPRTHLPPPPP